MKHIVLYKLFESAEEDQMIEEITYRISDLEDDGYIIRIFSNIGDSDHYRIGTAYNILITNKTNFSMDYIIPYLEHLKSYMNENGYKCITNSVESSEEVPFKSYAKLKFIKNK